MSPNRIRACIKKNPGVKHIKGDGKHKNTGGEKKTTLIETETEADEKENKWQQGQEE